MKIQSRIATPQPHLSPLATGQAQGAAAGARTAKAEAPRDGFTSRAAGNTGSGGVQSAFQQQFGALATDPKKFHDTMKTVFGEGYDSKLAENYRQKALQGDYSWLPKVRYVSSETLQGANGAYDSESGTVLLNSDLKSNPGLAASTFVEEAGHHLDAKLNKTDSAGDEGELFRRVMSGEKLSSAQISEIRNENDKGTITVDGKQVQVEFWNPFKAVAKAVTGAAKAVGNAVKSVGEAVVSVGKGIVGGVKTFAEGVGEGVGGFFKNIVQGKVGDAFQSLVRGADKAIFQAPARVISGVFDGAQNLLNGATGLLGPLGKPIQNIGTRVLDAGRTILDTGVGIARDVFRVATEPVTGFVKDMEKSVSLLFQGKFGEAAKQFGMAFVNAPARVLGGAVDMVMRGLQGAANVVLTTLGLEKPSRGLTSDEIAMLKPIYGDSIDYSMVRVKEGGMTDWLGMAAHVVGNTVYMPSKYFDGGGKLNTDGMDTLMHEMGHVWQNQNGGGDYIHKALFAQAMAAINGGSRNGAYDWREGVAEGKKFEELNPEQQASVGEAIGVALKDDGRVTATDFRPALSGGELAFIQDAWNKFKRGEGAP